MPYIQFLTVGCIIPKDYIIKKLKENDFVDKHKLDYDFELDEEFFCEFIYDDINKMLLDNDLPFEFSVPEYEIHEIYEIHKKKYCHHLIYTKLDTKMDVGDYRIIVDYKTLINEYDNIEKLFKKTLAFLFGESNINDFNLKIISYQNYSAKF